jgi:hypothetical protein
MRYVLTLIAALALASPALADPPLPPVLAKYFTLPPVEFDHPFPGNVRIVPLPIEEVQRNCPQTSMIIVACSYTDRVWNDCIVYVYDLAAKAARVLEPLLRHEIGHCNGWPADHPNARDPNTGETIRNE